MLSHDACHRAVRARDARFDGRFFTGVRTTGIYCRSVCPAITPKSENCQFFASAAAAQEAGYRPCRRCRPEAAPDSPAWLGTARSVRRALSLIGEGALDRGGGVDDLAARLGMTARQLRRLFAEQVGASPVAVARARRVALAKRLLDETELPIGQVALAAGFASVRRFNDEFRRTYQTAPRHLRRDKRTARADSTPPVSLRLSYRPPFNVSALFAFLAARAAPATEHATADRYRRAIAIEGSHGIVDVQAARSGEHALSVSLELEDMSLLGAAIARARRLFDLDAAASEIDAHLAADPLLAPLVTDFPGTRVPGAWNGFEVAVRAILGQQVSVSAATQLAGHLVDRYGEPLRCADPLGCLTRLFPRAQTLATARLSSLPMPRSRSAALQTLARACADGDLDLDLDLASDLPAALARLTALPGIGEWTAHYVAMRALREPDAFPATDIGLLRGAAANGQRPSPAELTRLAERWRPWRAYAAMYLWQRDASLRS